MPRRSKPSNPGGPTRRQLLYGVGSVLAATGFPVRSPRLRESDRTAATQAPAADGRGIGDVMTRLSTYMSEARNHPLPAKPLEQAKWHVLDTFAAMISGIDLPPGRAAVKFARAYGGKPTAMVVCSDILCGPIEAALVNGVLAHADETDDSWPGGWHPGCNVVPAALAVAEQFGITGAHFLQAVALGYDVGARLLIATRPALAEDRKSTHSIAGIFGAAAAASCAASLKADEMRWMLDYTAQQASGIASWYRDTDHIEKGFVFGGMPARSGVTSALLVQSGWTGVEDVLSGRDNYFLVNAPQAKPELMIERLGERFEVVGTNIKRWTVGSPIQAPLDAMEALLKRQDVKPGDVEQILVRSAPGSVVDNSEPPDINIQYAMALMLVDKTATFKSIHDKPRMQDPTILALRAKVKLEAPTRGAQLPLLEITLRDGRKLTQQTGPVLGTVDNPMTSAQLVAKCLDLMVPVFGKEKSQRVVDATLALETMKNIRDLRPALQHVKS